VLEQAALRVQRARYAFISGTGGQAELDQSRAALETLDALGAPLLARLHRERLTAVAGRVGMPSGRTRTVMFTDIVDSTRLMASAGNAAWAVILGEHHRIVRSVVGRFRGSIMTSTGDGFAAWFETPDDAVDAARALHPAIEHAALDVAGGSVTVRVGVASGSVFDLGATCVWCLTSAVIMIAMLAVLVMRRPAARNRKPAMSTARLATNGGLAAVGAVVVAAFVFAAPFSAPPGYQSALARHLTDTKAVMYGAFW